MVELHNGMDDLDAALSSLGQLYDRASLSPRASQRLAGISNTTKALFGRALAASRSIPVGATLLGNDELNAAVGGVGQPGLTASVDTKDTATVEHPQTRDEQKDEER